LTGGNVPIPATDVRITVSGGATGRETGELAHWLRRDRDLGLTVDLLGRPAEPGELGALVDIVVAAAGSGGAAVALCNSLREWFSTRVTKISIVVETEKGRVEVTAQNVDPDKVWAKVLEIMSGDD
jgi:Effector Associated Constant Component 1